MLPRGTLQVAVGLVVLGAASYIHLAVAGHSLTTADMADLSVVWSLVFSIGIGLYFPIEQEVTRVAAGRRVAGTGVAPLLRRGFVLSGLLTAGLVALAAASAPVLADRLFSGRWSLVLVTVAGILGWAVASPLRGIAAGVGDFRLYGMQMGLDGALRIVLAAVLGVAGLAVAGLRSADLYGLILIAAPLAATLLAVRPARRVISDGPPATRAELGHGLAPLIVSALLGQLILNAPVVSARLLAPADDALAAALLAALILIRVPIFIFSALQASLLSGLATAAAAGDLTTFGRMLRHASVVVTGLMVLGGIPAVLIGPWLIRTLFAAPDLLSWFDFAILAGGTLGYLLALVLGQGALSLRRHRFQMGSWIVGTVALVAVTLIPGDVRLRVEAAYAVSMWVAVAGLAVALFWYRHQVHAADQARDGVA
jgi:O-antigen/teichoic acid export membrane protein